MKYCIIGIFAAVSFLRILAQSTTKANLDSGNSKVITVSKGRVPWGQSVTLVDSSSGNYFVLDSAHITVSAYDRNGKILWKTNPWKDNHLDTRERKINCVRIFSCCALPNALSML
jgi:hypothetical protein